MDVLELRISSAEDLRDVRRLKVGKLMHPYAVAWVHDTRRGTRIDGLHKIDAGDHTSGLPRVDALEEEEEGTLYPTWPKQHPGLKITAVENASTLRSAFLVIRLFGQRSRSSLTNPKLSRRVVGTVTVPLADILNYGRPVYNHWQLLSYNVKRPSGRRQGVLNFSVCFASSSAARMDLPPSAPPVSIQSPYSHASLEFDNASSAARMVLPPSAPPLLIQSPYTYASLEFDHASW